MMNKYNESYNFEINKNVAEKLGLNYKDGVIMRNGEWFYFDPCNDPADAMPIIIENKISMIPTSYAAEWVSSHRHFRAINKNPLRAAMEVFLMMTDEENNNDRI